MKLKGVIIGAGYFSHYHVDAWSRMNMVDLLAVCDLNKDKAGLLAKRFGIPNAYQQVEEMLDIEKPDFVDIVTPPSTHKKLIQSAVIRGIHVICQKPLADSYEEVLEIKEIVDNAPIRFMVHENWRFQPWYREIKNLIAKGNIGDKVFQYAFRMRMGDGWGENAYLDRQPYFRDMPRLLVHETGVHFVDTFRYLEGEISEVFAQLKTLNPLIKGEDSGMIFFNFESGATGILDGNRYNEPFHDQPRYTFGEMLVEGEGGSIMLQPDGQIAIKPLGEKVFMHTYKPPKTGFGGDSVLVCQQHFINALEGEKPFETGMKEYFETLKVVEAIYLSHAEKATICVDKINELYNNKI